MPSGAGDGIVDSISFTPDAAGKLVVTATFSCQGGSGGDWGSAYQTKVFCTQGGSTTYGPGQPMTTTRTPQTARYVFDVVSGSAVECGIYGDIDGAVDANWWDITIVAELIKR